MAQICLAEKIFSVANKLPNIVSLKTTENLISIPEVDPKLISKLINAAIWGVIPFAIGVLLFLILSLYLCCAKKRKNDNIKGVVIAILVLFGIGAVYAYVAFSVSDVGKQYDKTEKVYVLLAKQVHNVLQSLIKLNSTISPLFHEIEQNMTIIRNSSDYQNLSVAIQSDFLAPMISNVHSQSNPMEDIARDLNKFDLMNYESYRQTAHTYFHKYIIPALTGLYAACVFLALLLGVCIYFRIRVISKLSLGLLLVVIMVALALSVLLLVVPLALSVACPQITPTIAKLNISLLDSIVDCKPNQHNPIMDDVINFNDTSIFPVVDLNCSLFTIPTACLNVDANLTQLRNISLTRLHLILDEIIVDGNTILKCDQIPGSISQLKCQICTKFIKSLFVVGFLSAAVSVVFLLFSFLFHSLMCYVKTTYT